MGRTVKVLRLPSFAKVNLGLEVLGTRADGYHELRTIFQTISLHDDVELRPHAAAIEVRCDHPASRPTTRTSPIARRRSCGGSRGSRRA